MYNTEEVLCYVCCEFAEPWTAILVGVDTGTGEDMWMHVHHIDEVDTEEGEDETDFPEGEPSDEW